MTIKKMVMTGAAALAVVSASAPAAGAVEAGAPLPGVLHQVGDALGTGVGDVGSHTDAKARAGHPDSTDLPRALGDSLRAVSGLLN